MTSNQSTNYTSIYVFVIAGSTPLLTIIIHTLKKDYFTC